MMPEAMPNGNNGDPRFLPPPGRRPGTYASAAHPAYGNPSQHAAETPRTDPPAPGGLPAAGGGETDPAVAGVQPAGGATPAKRLKHSQASRQGFSRRVGPGGAQALTQRQREVTSTEEASFAALELELGGRQQLAAILAGADLSMQDAAVAGLLADPLNDGISLAKVCNQGGVTMARLLKLFKEAVIIKGQVKALARIGAAIPDVAASVMEDAIPGKRVCPRCEGLSTIQNPKMPTATDQEYQETIECPKCAGKGTIIHVPLHEVQKTALQLGGLLDKGGGTRILNVNANKNVPPVGGVGVDSFDKLMTNLDSFLYGSGRDRLVPSGPVTDAEVEEDPSSG